MVLPRLFSLFPGAAPAAGSPGLLSRYFRQNAALALLVLAGLLLVPCAPAQTEAAIPPDSRYKADVLVVVAHPDDETMVDAYLAQLILGQKKRVAVVFGTRGNSGGNFAGQEQAKVYGAIREIEARQSLAKIGITHVWFLGAPDTPSQNVLWSLEAWGHGAALDQLVRLVRLTRPDVILTMLPDYTAGENHGDHQAAGVLATEAFDLAGNPTVFPEQVTPPRKPKDILNKTEGLHPWQPQKIYYFSDAMRSDFLKGQGPVYATTGVSPESGASYGRLAAEAASSYMTQGEIGPMAVEALKSNHLGFFEEPVHLIFGKSLVPSGVTSDVFAGVEPGGIAYQRAPGFIPAHRSDVTVELGGSWHFYRAFWAAHGVDRLANLVRPEVAIGVSSTLTIPLVLENPTAQPAQISLSAGLPPGWAAEPFPAVVQVGPGETGSVMIRIATPAKKASGWETVSVTAKEGSRTLATLPVRVRLTDWALPQ